MSWKWKEKSRDLLRQEEGTIIKSWGDKLSVALVYPNYYHVGMANLGFQAVYRTINNLPFAVCERVFFPERGGPQELLRSFSSQPLSSIENQVSLQDFDLIAFSLSFENDYPNILTLLDLARIPLRVSRRKEGYPIVFAGGITTFLNPEPLAEFMDFFALGEAEELLPECLNRIFELKTRELSRRELLKDLTSLKGIYVPQFYSVAYEQSGQIASFLPKKGVPEKVKRRWVKKVDKYPTHSVIHSPLIEFGGMSLVEIGRGCSFGCRFCASGWVYRPARMRSLDTVKKSMERALVQGKKVGLVSAAIGDHPKLKKNLPNGKRKGRKNFGVFFAGEVVKRGTP